MVKLVEANRFTPTTLAFVLGAPAKKDAFVEDVSVVLEDEYA